MLKVVVERLRSAENLTDVWERDAIRDFIIPTLNALGWDTADVRQVEREYLIGMGRVDFLLKSASGRRMLIEAKRPSQRLADHERQLLLYAFEDGIPFAALTNGCEWWLYLAMADGNWRSRKFCEVDLLRDDEDAAVRELHKFLSRESFDDDSIESISQSALLAWRASDRIKPARKPPINFGQSSKIEQSEQPQAGFGTYPHPHANGTKMRQVFDVLRESWATGSFLTELTGQVGGWQRWIQKHYVESGRYGVIVLLWKKRQSPSPMHLASESEAEYLLSDPEITIYPD